MKYPALHADDHRVDALKAQVAEELRAGEVSHSQAAATATAAEGTTSSVASGD